VSLLNPVNYIEGPNYLASIIVSDTQIKIHNFPAFPFCFDGVSTGAACTDAIDGFEFKFTGENILGATVNAASAPGFIPATFGSHVGLDLINNNDLLIDLTGVSPGADTDLIIDLSFTASPPPPPPPPPPVNSTPEPASLALFGSAVGGIAAVRRRRTKRS
jgi:hypothetical protein